MKLELTLKADTPTETSWNENIREEGKQKQPAWREISD
jgi:hypothetical protein